MRKFASPLEISGPRTTNEMLEYGEDDDKDERTKDEKGIAVVESDGRGDDGEPNNEASSGTAEEGKAVTSRPVVRYLPGGK